MFLVFAEETKPRYHGLPEKEEPEGSHHVEM